MTRGFVACSRLERNVGSLVTEANEAATGIVEPDRSETGARMPLLDPLRRTMALGVVCTIIVGVVTAGLGLDVLEESLRLSIAGGLPFFGLSHAAAFVVHVMALDDRARSRALWSALATEAAVFAARAALGGEPWLGMGSGLGLYAVLARAAMLRDPVSRAHHARILFDMSVFPGFALFGQPLLALTASLCPNVLDATVIQVDEALGGQAGFYVAQLFAALPVLAGLSGLVYTALPLGLAGLHGAELARDRDARPVVLASFFVIAAVGYFTYLAFPCVGPAFCLGPVLRLHIDANALASLVVDPDAPRNCVPSLHTSWALIIALRAGRFGRRAQIIGVAWLALTLLATLGLGYHYVFDLVVALPFAVTLLGWAEGLTQRPGRRWLAWSIVTAFALTLTLLSVFTLHDWLARSPWLVRAAMLALVGLGLKLMQVRSELGAS